MTSSTVILTADSNMSSSESNFLASSLIGVPSSLSLIDTIDDDIDSVLLLN